MSKDKFVKKVVAHPRYYQKLKLEGEKEGKLRHIPVGTEIEVTEAQAERAGTKLIDAGQDKSLVGGQLVDKAAGKGGDDSKELKAQLAAALAENEKLKKAAK